MTTDEIGGIGVEGDYLSNCGVSKVHGARQFAGGVRALQNAGFRVVRQGKHIATTASRLG
jgi:hypothetical protein